MTDPRAAISSWSPMVQQIKAGSESAVDELYSSIRSIRFFLFRQIGPDHAEDAYHAVIVDLVSAIRKGGLRDPETLPAFAMTIARRKVYERIRQAVRERQSLDVDS